MAMTEKPRFQNTYSVGTIIQVGALIVSISVGWALLEARTKANDAAIAREAEIRQRFEEETKAEVQQLSVRMRNAESQITRGDERYSSILNMLSRIDQRLENIERGERP